VGCHLGPEADAAPEGACTPGKGAFAVYAKAEPDKAADRIGASHTVNLMIASTIRADPEWFWRPLKERMEGGEIP
jgi:hypothetical protein